MSDGAEEPRRAPVQADLQHPQGTIAWEEHELAWTAYSARYGREQSAVRISERWGFSFGELEKLLGHPPTTWRAWTEVDARACWEQR